jgi:2'-5' RNA ligase
MGEAAARHRAHLLEIDGIGAFPSMRKPAVVWAGILPDPRLELLHHDIEEACAALGFELDGRPFRPHVTLGRVRRGGRPPDASALAEVGGNVRPRAEFMVESVDLMLSKQEVSGSSYEALSRARLRPE